jgi:hypothetical protein
MPRLKKTLLLQLLAFYPDNGPCWRIAPRPGSSAGLMLAASTSGRVEAVNSRVLSRRRRSRGSRPPPGFASIFVRRKTRRLDPMKKRKRGQSRSHTVSQQPSGDRRGGGKGSEQPGVVAKAPPAVRAKGGRPSSTAVIVREANCSWFTGAKTIDRRKPNYPPVRDENAASSMKEPLNVPPCSVLDGSATTSYSSAQTSAGTINLVLCPVLSVARDEESDSLSLVFEPMHDCRFTLSCISTILCRAVSTFWCGSPRSSRCMFPNGGKFEMNTSSQTMNQTNPFYPSLAVVIAANS